MSHNHTEHLFMKKPQNSPGQNIYKRSITPNEKMPLTKHKSLSFSIKKPNLQQVVAPKLNPQNISKGVKQMDTILQKHTIRDFRHFLMSVIDQIKIDMVRFRQVKLVYDENLAKRTFSLWKNLTTEAISLQKKISESSVSQTHLKQKHGELCANEKIIQFLNVTQYKSIQLQIQNNDKSKPQPSQTRSERTPKKIPKKSLSDNSKPTIKKPILPREKSIKYILSEEHTIETKIKTTDKCPSMTSEKYNTPQFKSITWDSDEDQVQAGKSIVHFKINQKKKILQQWFQVIQDSKKLNNQFQQMRLVRIMKEWKKQSDLVKFNMFKARHFHNFFLLRSMFTSLQVEVRQVKTKLEDFKKQNEIKTLRKVIFGWELQLQKIRQYREKQKVQKLKKCFFFWKKQLNKIQSNGSAAQSLPTKSTKLPQRPTSPILKQFGSKSVKK